MPLSYSEICKECISNNSLYEDPEFPAADKSLFFSRKPDVKYEWKRPHEICEDPKLFVGGASRFDIKQGKLGDCWLLAAIASMSLNESLLYRVIPQDQSFERGKYAGVFHFQFWQYGKWMDVIVDDLLPTYNNRLVYLHSNEKNEFWSALLEKAYAKLNGSYEALKGGSTAEAMEDFTGGITETYELREAPKNLYNIMSKSNKKGALMGCAIECSQNQVEAKLDNGLIMGHAYSVTAVKMLSNGTKLVRVRNPWGQVEWKGAWSDDSATWKTISSSERNKLQLDFGDDGEFWMDFKDFCSNYSKLEICNLEPGTLKATNTTLYTGRWLRGSTAGGCRNYSDTFWLNPQFRLELQEEDDDPDDDTEGCSFICSLMQKNRRKQKAKGLGLLTIGYAFYKLKDADEVPLKKDYFLKNKSCIRSKSFINTRANSERFKLPPGKYVVVPSTFQPNQEADFVFRIYTEKPSNTAEIDVKTTQVQVAATIKREDATEYDQKFKQLFVQLAGKDGEIDAFELQHIANAVIKKNNEFGKFEGFSKESSRSMIAMADATQSGKLDYAELKDLWHKVRRWISIFKLHDKDRSGSFDSYELREALASAGYKLSSKLYQMLCLRYASKDMTINMDDFVLLSIRLEAMFKQFNTYKKDGKATLSLDSWLLTTMYN